MQKVQNSVWILPFLGLLLLYDIVEKPIVSPYNQFTVYLIWLTAVWNVHSSLYTIIIGRNVWKKSKAAARVISSRTRLLGTTKTKKTPNPLLPLKTRASSFFNSLTKHLLRHTSKSHAELIMHWFGHVQQSRTTRWRQYVTSSMEEGEIESSS